MQRAKVSPRGTPMSANFHARSVPARTRLGAAMSSKRHRVVLGLQAFQHMAHLLNDRAMECAENEGWPIPAVAGEPTRSIARAGIVKRAAVLLRQHVQKELHFWSGRKASQHRGKIHLVVAQATSAATK